MDANLKNDGSLKHKNRMLNFTTLEKRQLVNCVKEWPRIWDISNTLHCNKNAVNQSWLHISNALEKSVDECKSAWISMRESYRYHARVANKNKSGSDGGEVLETPSFSENVDWELAEEMSFLMNVSHKRKTFTTPVSFGEDSHASPIHIGEDSNVSQTSATDSQHSYDYNPTPTKRRRRLTSPSKNQAWSRFDNILMKQEEMLESRSNTTRSSPYAQALSSFDWLLTASICWRRHVSFHKSNATEKG
ncbi:uncharacterized protein LOC120780069 [Bactrocera tryoni]|uniref:uncharacterized protein LOC120780069 n=1 Tax=Bactrocera tryoni TaxID=59916 RepID=UPI001A97C423|nr:uncharacterized protein LOC120780069 [Bactrocera tryoni]